MSVPILIRKAIRTRRRLAVTGVGFCVVVAIIGSCTGSPTKNPGNTAGTRAPSAARGSIATTTTVPPPATTTTATTVKASITSQRKAPTGTVPPAVTQAAVAFAQAWARPNLPEPVWLAGARPLATQAFGRLLALTYPGNVPDTRVLGVGLETGDSGGGQVQVVCDHGNVVVFVTRVGARYLVSEITS